MKTKILLLSVFFLSILVFSSCSNNGSSTNSTTPTSSDVAATQTVDNSVDDVSVIADDQYEVHDGTATGKLATTGYTSIFANVTNGVSISTVGTTTATRVITLAFGTTVGTAITPFVFRGRNLRGQIVLTWSIGTTFPKTMTITYNNFYINDNKLDGTTTWKREMVGSGTSLHPKTTFTATNMTLTTKAGVYTRNGDRVREMTAGFLTRTDPTDNVFSTYGTFTTTHPNGNVFTTFIDPTTPLIHKTACDLLAIPSPFPVQGVLKLTKNTHFATIDYGSGTCDNLAMLSIDGGVATQITLGK